MSVLPTGMCVHHMCVWCLGRSEERVIVCWLTTDWKISFDSASLSAPHSKNLALLVPPIISWS